MAARPRFASRCVFSCLAAVVLAAVPVTAQPPAATAKPAAAPAAADDPPPPQAEKKFGWQAGAGVGLVVALVVGGALAMNGKSDKQSRAKGNGLGGWAPPGGRTATHCKAFLELPPQHRDFIREHLLGASESVVWVGKTSAKVCLLTLALVLVVGGGVTATWFLYCSNGGGWDGKGGLVAFFLIGLTGFFAYLAVLDNGNVIYLLTSQRAVAVYPVPRGYASFSYNGALAESAEVSPHWLLPGVGSVVFPAARAQPAADPDGVGPGPCGFVNVDRPGELAALVRSTFGGTWDDEPVALTPAGRDDRRARTPGEPARADRNPDALMDIFRPRA